MKTTTLMKRLAVAGLVTGLAGSALGQEQPRRAGGLLAVLDLNGNGTLEADEIDLAVASLRKLDRNGDGNVSPEELRGPERGPGRPPGARRPDGPQRGPGLPAFAQMDRDGDGRISKEETPERMKERFEQMDRNGDGFLDKEEHEAVLTRLRQRLQEGGPRRPAGPGARPERGEGEGGTEEPARPAPKDE